MPDKQTLVSNLASARERIIGLLERAKPHSEEQLYSDGAAWTIRQLATHLMIADRGITMVIQNIASGGNPIPEDYDVDRYNKRSVEKMPDVSIDAAIAAMRDSRADLLAWLEGADEAALTRVGRHPLRFEAPLSRFLEIMALHDHQHADDLEKYLNEKDTASS